MINEKISKDLKEKYILKKESKALKRINQLFERNLKEATKGKKLLNKDKLTKILTDEDFIISCYEKLKLNKKAVTKETEKKETAEKFSLEEVKSISEKIRKGTYEWKTIRRKNVSKPGKKKVRPIEITNINDKIVQEMIRIVLNAIFEPTFQMTEYNHGFRPKRSIETVMQAIKEKQQGTTTALKGEVKLAYNKVNNKILMKIIRKRITDEKFLKLLKEGLDAGIQKEEKIYHTLTGVPLGGICSPILFNIYMEPFDEAIVKITKEHLDKINNEEKRVVIPISDRYRRLDVSSESIKTKITRNFVNKKHRSKEEKETRHKQLLKELNLKNKQKRKIKRLSQSRRILFFKYVRYAGHWIILINAAESECNKIKTKIKNWLNINLKLELSEEKTLITNFQKEPARFLGFTIFMNQNLRVTTYKNQYGTKVKQRVNIGAKIGIDDQRLKARFLEEGIIKQKIINKKKRYMPKLQKRFTSQKKFDIVEIYSQKITRLIDYYYQSITDKSRLIQYYYYYKYSLLMTLAFIEKSSISTISKKYGPKIEMNREIKKLNIKGDKVKEQQKTQFNKYKDLMNWASKLSIEKETQRIIRRIQLKRSSESIKVEDIIKNVKINDDPFRITNFRTRTTAKLKEYCSICGAEPSRQNPLETHHIKHLKKARMLTFGDVMQALHRKTIVCCKQCHNKIHKGKYDGIALNQLYDNEIEKI